MKKSRRRIKFISLIILAIVVFAVIIAIATKKSNTYATEFTATSGVKYTYTASSNKLAISGSGTVTDVWKNNDKLGITGDTYKTIEEIEIANDVTGIDKDAFSECISLTTVSFKETSKVTFIGENAFSGCTALNNIEIPDSVTDIADSAFSESMEVATLDEETEEDVIENHSSESGAVTLTTTDPYSIPTSGKYKIELYGQKGHSTNTGGADGNRVVDGGKASYVVGYMNLSKGTILTPVLYAGGVGQAHQVDATKHKTNNPADGFEKTGGKRTYVGGTGGNGIGFRLGESSDVVAVSGGGAGSNVEGCSQNKEKHGGAAAKNTFDPSTAPVNGSPGLGLLLGKYGTEAENGSCDPNWRWHIGGSRWRWFPFWGRSW